MSGDVEGVAIHREAHGSVQRSPGDERRLRSRYKTELCRQFAERGRCRYGVRCQFAHGRCELRSVERHPKYKTHLCRTFHSAGLCPYGPRCHFIHNEPAEPPSFRPNTADAGNLEHLRAPMTTLDCSTAELEFRLLGLIFPDVCHVCGICGSSGSEEEEQVTSLHQPRLSTVSDDVAQLTAWLTGSGSSSSSSTPRSTVLDDAVQLTAWLTGGGSSSSSSTSTPRSGSFSRTLD